VSIIETPGLGNQPAVDLCIAMKVASQNESVKLEQIRCKIQQASSEAVMLKGRHAGKKVSMCRDSIEYDMLESGDAFHYAEPDQRIVSRSGNDCVVAHTEQWYIAYGEDVWKRMIQAHLECTLKSYTPQAQKDLLAALEWLHEWACSRTFGLGTKLPWDPSFVIESLSDSTVYMAFYTVAHLVQNYPKECFNDHIWNYLFLHDEFPEYPSEHTTLDQSVADKMRNEFAYWYPVDLRVSGKDLIQNHLTMSLYNHAAIWEKNQAMWPQSYYTNGHLMIDGQKMSKSDGNFITLSDAIDTYSADATRLALADAGDGMEDANFERGHAANTAMKLSKEMKWIQEMIEWDRNHTDKSMRTGEPTFEDQCFLNAVHDNVRNAKNAYERMCFRDAAKYSFYQMLSERDAYRTSLRADKKEETFHRKTLISYIGLLATILSPICPHICQSMWEHLGNKDGFVKDQLWPDVGVDENVLRQSTYLRETKIAIRKSFVEAIEREGKKFKNDKSVQTIVANAREGKSLVKEEVSRLIDSGTLYVATSYHEWQENSIDLVTLSKEGDLSTRALLPEIKKISEVHKIPQVQVARFVSSIVTNFKGIGNVALEKTPPFREMEVLTTHLDAILHDIGIAHFTLVKCADVPHAANSIEKAVCSKSMPGSPCMFFFHSQA
jgi:leucyl-tRNA synthetase